MKGRFGDLARLRHIFDSILIIESYTKQATKKGFIANRMMADACTRQLGIIGEAANHISKSFKSVYSEVEWHKIIGFRNILIHEYFDLDVNIIWAVIKKDLPGLKKEIANILKQLSNEEKD